MGESITILKDAVEKYFDDDQLKSPFCNTDNFWPPLILFPDLTSDYYKGILVDEEKGWLLLLNLKGGNIDSQVLFQHGSLALLRSQK